MDRSYVVAEETGPVDIFLNSGRGIMGLPDSRDFRVEKGKIRYVHAMSV